MPKALALRPFARIFEPEASHFGDPVSRPRLVAPDPGGDLADWQSLDVFDAHSGGALAIGTDPTEIGIAVVDTLRAKAVDWVRPRHTARLPGIIVDPLLLRGVGRASGAFNDGSPQPVVAEIDAEGVLVQAISVLGSPTVAELTGISDSTLRYFQSRQPQRTTVRRAVGALTQRFGTDALSHLLDSVETADNCALPGCDEPSRPRSRTCSERHKKTLSRLTEVPDA
jgi:hypothetical protein